MKIFGKVLLERAAVTKLQSAILIIVVLAAALLGVIVYYAFLPSLEPIPDEILIGNTMALSGAYGVSGAHYQAGYEWGVEYINEKEGGVYIEEYDRKLPVRLVTYDDESDPTKSRSLYEKLVDVDGVVALLGPYTSYITYSASVVTEAREVPMLSQGWSDAIYERGFEYVFNHWYYASDLGRGQGFGGFIMSDKFALDPPVETVAMIYQDTEFPAYCAVGFRETALLQNLTIVMYEKYPPGTLDFSSIMARLNTLEPDVIAHIAYSTENIEFVKELEEYEVDADMFIVVMGHHFPEFIPQLGDAADYICGYVHYVDAPYNDDVKPQYDFYKAKRDEAGLEYPEEVAEGVAFEMVITLCRAMERGGSLDPKKIRDALDSIHVTTIWGETKFDEKGLNVLRIETLIQIQDGEWKILATPPGQEEHIDAEIAYPCPNWSDR